jgi:hypothetical protein
VGEVVAREISQSTKPKRLYKFHISKISKKKTEAVNNTCQSIIDVLIPKIYNDFPKNMNSTN